MLVTCEGIDGSGKSTAVRALAAALRARGLDVHESVEPTRTWLGEAVRRGFQEPIAPWSEALLFMADHATHAQQARALLAQGKIVLSDRWSDSTFAYQGASLAGASKLAGVDVVALLQRMEAPFELAPDLTLLFDIDEKIAMERVGKRGAAEKFERADFLGKVRANYLRLARESPARFVTLDASRAPDIVLRDALRAIDERLASRQR